MREGRSALSDRKLSSMGRQNNFSETTRRKLRQLLVKVFTCQSDTYASCRRGCRRNRRMATSAFTPFFAEPLPASSKNPPSSSEPKIEDPPSSIFGCEDRRTPHLRSSVVWFVGCDVHCYCYAVLWIHRIPHITFVCVSNNNNNS